MPQRFRQAASAPHGVLPLSVTSLRKHQTRPCGTEWLENIGVERHRGLDPRPEVFHPWNNANRKTKAHRARLLDARQELLLGGLQFAFMLKANGSVLLPLRDEEGHDRRPDGAAAE